MDPLDELLSFVERVGITGALAFYILIRLERTFKTLTGVINDLVRELKVHMVDHHLPSQ
tara:strand:+ start:224 stop:400 length:177 start_codon:yes stop_codon:yes gene_type:complete